MHKFTTPLLCSVLVLFPVCLLGCGGSNNFIDSAGTVEADGLPDARTGLVEMAEMFQKVFKGDATPPKKAADYEKYEIPYPTAGLLLTKGKIVYHGGKFDKSAPPALLGYAKDAATAGGWVLMTNGDVKEVTAAEFAELSKSGK